MSVAHARGIVHRDLKPDNVFIVSDPAVPGGERTKILDFGIAKLLGDHEPSASRTQSGVILGTPMYMSPEQCRGASTVDHRTDIYALGCILYVMICGRPPFINDTAGDMIASHLLEEPEPPSTHVGVPVGLDRPHSDPRGPSSRPAPDPASWRSAISRRSRHRHSGGTDCRGSSRAR